MIQFELWLWNAVSKKKHAERFGMELEIWNEDEYALWDSSGKEYSPGVFKIKDELEQYYNDC